LTQPIGESFSVEPTFPRNELEQGLAAAYAGTSPLSDWLDDLATAEVWVPLAASSEEGRGSFPILSIDGGSYLPAFTSEGELRAGNPGASYVRATLADLLRRLPGHIGVAVNPGGSVGLPIPADDARRLVSGEGRIPAGTTIRVGHPADEPDRLLAAVASEFGAAPHVTAARRCWAAAGESLPGVVLGIDVDPDNPDARDSVVQAVRRAARASDYDGTVDVVFANDRDAFTEWMLANTEPFYRA